MPTIITCRIHSQNGPVSAYLADGSGEPIVFRDARKAHAWAYMHKALFEQTPGDVIVRGRFGMDTAETLTDAEAMLHDRVPCYPFDTSLVQDDEDMDWLVGVIGRVSLEPDMDAYAQRLALPPEERE